MPGATALGLTVLGPQRLGSLSDGLHLPGSHLVGVDVSFGKGAETAVGVEENLFGVEVLQQLFDPVDDLLCRFYFVSAGVDDAEARFLSRCCIP